VQRTLADYAATGATVGPHLVALLRGELRRAGVVPAEQVLSWPNGSWLKIAGLVIIRQRPGTAKGIVFVTLEDETGLSNAVVDPETFQTHRRLLLTSALLLIEGPLQNVDGVATVKARRISPLRAPARPQGESLPASRNFH
jgi:error-prone DNA polymerase